MKALLIASLLLPSSAFAWEPTCPVDGSSDFTAVTTKAQAVDRRVDESSLGMKYFSARNPKSLAALTPWLLDQLNGDSLLYAQLAGTLDEMNNQHSNNAYTSLFAPSGQPCRREKFAAKDLRLVTAELKGTELAIRFQVLTQLDSRWDSTFYGEEFAARFSANYDKAMKRYDLTLTEYPGFVREVELRTEHD